MKKITTFFQLLFLFQFLSAQIVIEENDFIDNTLKSTTSATDLNDDPSGAIALTIGTRYSSYINPSGDVDWAMFYISESGTINILFEVPSGLDYDIELYNSSAPDGKLEGSYSGAGTDEIITYHASSTGWFYIKRYGYSGAFSDTENYYTTVSFTSDNAALDVDPDFETLQINGNTVYSGNTYTIYLDDLNSTFQLRIQGENDGEDECPDNMSYLGTSFEQFTSSLDKNNINYGSRSSDLEMFMGYGYEAQGGDGYANYVMVEGSDNDGWGASESNYYYLDIKPKNWGDFVIHYKLVMATNSSGSEYDRDPATGASDPIGEPSYTVTLNIRQSVDLDVGVSNVPEGGAGLPGANGIVKLYSSNGSLYDEDRTNTSGIAEFRDVPAANDYFIKVYHDPIPDTEFGDEYWGTKTNMNLLGSMTHSFQRNMPYISNYRIEDISGNEITHDNLTLGNIANVEITVKNPGATSYIVRPLGYLDKSRSSGYDHTFSVQSGSVAAGSTRTFTYQITPSSVGDYFMAAGVETYVDGSYQHTDGGYWDTNITLKVEIVTIDLDVGVSNVPEGGAGLPGANGIVKLYSSNGSLYDEDRTNTSGIAEFRDVSVANDYFIKVYHDPIPDTEFGDEYWGTKTNMDLLGSMTHSFQRNMPYISNYRIEDISGNEITHDNLTLGNIANVEITVKNPGATSYTVRPLGYLDKSKSSGYDHTFSVQSGSVAAGSTGTFTYQITPSSVGDYFMAAGVETYVDGSYQHTDGGYWDTNITLKVEIVTIDLDIGVSNVPEGGAGLPGANGIVKLYSSNGSLYDEDRTNISGIAEFRDVPAANDYFIKVYHDPIPDTEFGDEYWGTKTNMDLLGSMTHSFQRNMPYISNYRIEDISGNEITHDNLTLGNIANVEITVKNPGAISYTVRPLGYLDKSKSSGYDHTFSVQSGSVAAGSTGTFTYQITPSSVGDYFMAAGVETYVDGSYQITDGGYWDTNTTLLIKNNYPPIDIPILMYHNIDDISKSEYWLALDDFEAQMNSLACFGFNPVSLYDVMNYVNFGTTLPQNPIVLTFDDGYQNFYTKAYPILRNLGFKANSFLITDYIGDSENDRKINSWDTDPTENSFNNPHLIWSEISEMNQNGITFGSHSKSHPLLTSINASELESEISDSKAIITTKLGKCDFFSYPYGGLNSDVVNMVKQTGYFGAIDIIGDPVFNTSSSDLFRMQRIYVPADMDINTFSQAINPNLDFPDIVIQSVAVKDELGNIKTEFNKGENLVIEVNIKNDGASVTTVVSLNLDGDNNSTTPPLYDSHLTNPVEDKIINIGGNGDVKTIQFTWQVPIDTDANQWYYDIGFHGQEYILWYGGTGWTSAFNVNLGILTDWTTVNVGGVDYLVQIKTDDEYNLADGIISQGYCDVVKDVAIFSVIDGQKYLVTNESAMLEILTNAANKVLLNNTPEPVRYNSIHSSDILFTKDVIDKDGNPYKITSLIDLSNDERLIRDPLINFTREGTDFYNNRYKMYTELINSLVYHIDEDQILSFMQGSATSLEEIRKFVEYIDLSATITDKTFEAVKISMIKALQPTSNTYTVFNTLNQTKNISRLNSFLSKFAIITAAIESAQIITHDQITVLFQYLLLTEVTELKIETLYNSVNQALTPLNEKALVDAIMDVRYDFYDKYNKVQGGEWTILLNYIFDSGEIFVTKSLPEVAFIWAGVGAAALGPYAYLVFAPIAAEKALIDSRNKIRNSILSTNLHEILYLSIKNKIFESNEDDINITSYGTANNLMYLSAYIAHNYVADYLNDPLVVIGSVLNGVSDRKSAIEYFNDNATTALDCYNNTGAPWYFSGIPESFYNQTCLAGKLTTNYIDEETVSPPILSVTKTELILTEEVSLFANGAVSNHNSLLQYQFDFGNGIVSPWTSGNIEYTFDNEGDYNVKVRARSQNNESIESTWSNNIQIKVTNLESITTPDAPDSPDEVEAGEMFEISASRAVSNIGNALEYQFYFGNGIYSGWGESTITYAFVFSDIYEIFVRARSTTNSNVVSDWSEPSLVNVINPIRLASISVDGSNEVDENSIATFSCTAHYNDGSSSDITNLAFWSINTVSANINQSGELTTLEVDAEKLISIYAAYGVFTESYNVTIINFDDPTLTVPVTPTDLDAIAIDANQIQISWFDNSDNETGFEIQRSASSGTGFINLNSTSVNAVLYLDVTALPEMTYYYRVRAINSYGESAFTQEVSVTTPAIQSGSSSFGYTDVFAGNSTTANRRALPVTIGDAGSIQSVSIYHSGNTDGSGLLLGVYDDLSGMPSTLLATTSITSINSTEGWQSIDLISPASLVSGQTVWLAWVFENNPGIRYQSGTPGRAQSSSLWPDGMPQSFGGATFTNFVYSVYCTVTTSGGGTPPSSPTDLNASAIDAYQVQLNWFDNSDDETGFEIQRSTSSGTGFTSLYSSSVDVVSYIDATAQPEMTYYYRVSAVNSYGESAFSQEVSVTTPIDDTPTTAPIAPTDLDAIAIDANQVQVSWFDNSDNETGFEIQRSTSSGTGFINLNSTSVNSVLYLDATALPEMTYYYRIRAINSYGESAFTQEVSVTTPAIQSGSSSFGYTDVFAGNSTTANRRALPVTIGDAGSIQSVSIYHSGSTDGSGLLLGVYDDLSGTPGTLLGTTSITSITSTEGWQSIDLISPASVVSGQTVWLAWVFENNPGIRYQAGTPGRAQSSSLWPDGMPQSFGGATFTNFVYSVYCTVTSSDIGVAPSVMNVQISPVDPMTTDNLQLEYIYLDPENDPESGSEIRWFKDGVTQPALNDNLLVDASNIAAGEQWHATIRPSDGVLFGEIITSNIVIISESNINPDGGIVFGDFALTTDVNPETSDWSEIVQDIFGFGFVVADWNDLVDYYNQGGDLTELMDGLGITPELTSAFVTLNGEKQYSDTRWYFISRHDHNKPSTYLAHSNLDNYLISLGSWSGQRRILAKRKNYISAEPVAIEFAPLGESVQLQISSNTNWTVNESASWATVSQESGFGNASITVTASENSGANYYGEDILIFGEGVDMPAFVYISQVPPYLSVSPSSLIIGGEEGSISEFNINSDGRWYVLDDVDWLDYSSSGGTGNATITITANSSNLTNNDRVAFLQISVPGIPPRDIIVTQEPLAFVSTDIGYTDVFAGNSTTANRRALPVTMGDAGSIQSVSIYHSGSTDGSGLLLGVYDDLSGTPGTLLGTTSITAITSTEGWQSLDLISPASVISGQTVWLAWVFENNPGIRYQSGTPGRAQSSSLWPDGMPQSFGGATFTNFVYSVYCTVTSTGEGTPPLAPTDLNASAIDAYQVQLNWSDNSDDETGFEIQRSISSGIGFTSLYSSSADVVSYIDATVQPEMTYYYRVSAVNSYGESVFSQEVSVTTPTVQTGSPTIGNTEIFANSSTSPYRRALPFTMSQAGIIQSVSIYHSGSNDGSGLLLGVYDDLSGSPGTLLGETPITVINSTEGWQSINLISPTSVALGQTIWLAWVFENNPGIRYQSGVPGRAQAASLWADGLPQSFGTAGITNFIYSIYANYIYEPNAFNIALGQTDNIENDKKVLIYPNPTHSKVTIKWVYNYEDDIVLSVYNFLGKMVENRLIDSNSKEIVLDMSNYKHGIYFLELKTINSEELMNRSKIIKY